MRKSVVTVALSCSIILTVGMKAINSKVFATENGFDNFKEPSTIDFNYNKNIYYEGDEIVDVSSLYNNEDNKDIINKNNMSIEEIINIICINNNLTVDEFNIIKAICIAESNRTYEDAYAVINSMYNRTINTRWINDLESRGKDGTNLYDHATASGQYVVYEEGLYKKYIDIYEGEAFNGIVDFLLTKEIMHDYLSFRAAGTGTNGVQFSPNGNRFMELMPEEERVLEEEVVTLALHK